MPLRLMKQKARSWVTSNRGLSLAVAENVHLSEILVVRSEEWIIKHKLTFLSLNIEFMIM